MWWWYEKGTMCADQRTEREVHKAHPAEALQAQQLCQFRAAAEQI